MEKEAATLKTKQILQSLTRQPQTKGNKMQKEASSLKTKKKPRKPNPTALNQPQ